MSKLSLAVLVLSGGVSWSQSLPQNWVGAGSGYSSSGSPKVTGWVSLAVLVSQSQQLYSYSTYDVLPVKGGVPTTSARTGLATVIRHYGMVSILAFGNIGMEQNSTSIAGAFSGGGFAVAQFKSGLTFEVGARIVTSGGKTASPIEAGFGWTF